MIETKIHNLKNIIFIKSTIGALLIICGIYVISALREKWIENLSKLEIVRPLISETKVKLNEITGNNSNITEGIEKYNEILGKTEEARCKEYNDILIKISNLTTKHSLPGNINIIVPSKPTRLNNLHNKSSYISVYDLTIEYNSYNILDSLEVYSDIISLLPEYSIIYFTDIKEVSSVVPRKISPAHIDAKPSLVRCKICVKMRDVILNHEN